MDFKETPIVVATIDSYYFRMIMGKTCKSEEEMDTFTHLIKKGVESQLDWESINDNAKQYLENQ